MFDSEEVTEASGWLNRNVVGLAINRFLSDFGHEAGTAILPLFLAAIGAPAIALGLIEEVRTRFRVSPNYSADGWVTSRTAPAMCRGWLPADGPNDGPVWDVSLVALDAHCPHHRMGGARTGISAP